MEAVTAPIAAEHLLAVSAATEECVEAWARALAVETEGLDVARLRRALSQELWYAGTDIALLAASGAKL